MGCSDPSLYEINRSLPIKTNDDLEREMWKALKDDSRDTFFNALRLYIKRKATF